MKSKQLLIELDSPDVDLKPIFIFLSSPSRFKRLLISMLKSQETNIIIRQENKRINDEELKSFNFNYLTGKKGDMYLVDTSQCFHAGSRKSSKDRYLVMIQYLTPFSYMRKNKKNKLGFMFDRKILSNLEKKLFSFN